MELGGGGVVPRSPMPVAGGCSLLSKNSDPSVWSPGEVAQSQQVGLDGGRAGSGAPISAWGAGYRQHRELGQGSTISWAQYLCLGLGGGSWVQIWACGPDLEVWAPIQPMDWPLTTQAPVPFWHGAQTTG